MPNTAAPPALLPPSSNQGLGSLDKEQSPGEYSSGIDSDSELVGPNGSRALKRKRPLTVSYVPELIMPHTRP
ncbi:hypothetical protein PENSUB_11773 [Penicillium subrubescens]|uniref:Uncharacterized protein n=1 Tax=Penicillium subrubescens TaxID=1316194 RepID=A0A1Q5T2S8_9EURO|nr:hypothetical protein PENSUB_11773 [Penicillium subrubescens]